MAVILGTWIGSAPRVFARHGSGDHARSRVALETERTGPRRVAASAALLGSTAAFQLSGAVAVPVFALVGVPGTSGLRFAFAAPLLLTFVRPRLRGRSRAHWTRVVLLGLTLAAMNLCSYEALHRLPLGTATTVEVLGPLAIAVAASRGLGQLSRAAVTLAGVFLIAGPTLQAEPLGLLFAALAAAVLAGYLVLQDHVGRHGAGLEGLTLAIAVAAMASLPFAIGALGALTPGAVWRVAVSAALGVGLSYWLDARALRLSGRRQVGVLLSLEPALAAAAGLVVLGQDLPPRALLGLAVVVTASAACLGTGSRAATRPQPTREHEMPKTTVAAGQQPVGARSDEGAIPVPALAAGGAASPWAGAWSRLAATDRSDRRAASPATEQAVPATSINP